MCKKVISLRANYAGCISFWFGVIEHLSLLSYSSYVYIIRPRWVSRLGTAVTSDDAAYTVVFG